MALSQKCSVMLDNSYAFLVLFIIFIDLFRNNIICTFYVTLITNDRILTRSLLWAIRSPGISVPSTLATKCRLGDDFVASFVAIVDEPFMRVATSYS